MVELLYPTTQNGLQKTLDVQLDQGVTASATFNNTTGIQNKPGLFVVDRIDANGVEKSAADREYIIFAGTSGSTVVTLVRGLGGSSDQDHGVGAVVEFVHDVVIEQRIIDALATVVDPTNISALNSAIATLTGTQTLTNKTLTSPVLTTPQINDTSLDHQYVFAPSELAADRTVTLPLLGGNDVFVFADFIQTLTNKRITDRVQSVADATTVTPNADTNDAVDITAIAQAFTIANPTGTPTNFQKLIIRIKDNGTARAITWGNGYVAGGTALPSTTVLSKILTLGFIYNTANTLNKWQLVASAQEA